MLHSSPSAHSYQNISKPDHNNSISNYDDDHDDCLRNTEKDKLLPKSESHQIVSSSVIRYFTIFKRDVILIENITYNVYVLSLM